MRQVAPVRRWHFPTPAKKTLVAGPADPTPTIRGGLQSEMAGRSYVGYSPLASRTSFSRRAMSVILTSPLSRRSRPIEPSRLSSRQTASRCVLTRSAISEREGDGENNTSHPVLVRRRGRQRPRSPHVKHSATALPLRRSRRSAIRPRRRAPSIYASLPTATGRAGDGVSELQGELARG